MVAEVALFSEINTKHIRVYTVWTESKIL
jgi:hypothetical protein